MRTTLFRHFKNKPYKFIGTAKHSETLDDYVIYETLYDNPRAKLWVRPKAMFFENVNHDGLSIPRFAEVPIEIRLTTEMTPTRIEEIEPILRMSFDEWRPDNFAAEFEKSHPMCLVTAHVDGDLVGCKVGFEADVETFYSWLGAVSPQFRRLGVGRVLMKAQHDWCRSRGYKRVLTKTRNKFKSMLHLNIEGGFEVVGTENAENGQLKVIMEKQL